jgi:hypothetical protein
MAVTLNASTTSGFVQSADNSGELVLQNNGTTRLTVNASGVTIPTLTTTTVTGTIVQGTAVASTSGTSIDFTGIPSWAKRVTVMFSGVSGSGTSPFQIQLGDAGGIETTGYVSSAWTAATSYQTGVTSGFVLNGATAAAAVYHGNIIISLQSTNAWVSSHSLGASGGTFSCLGGGSKTLSDTLTQVRITTVNGTDTFDAGSINIQYEG